MMIAAMAAAVSAASTLRLLSCRTDLSGRSALAAGVGLLGGGTGAGAWIVGPLKATGFANTDSEDVTETGASGTFWRPTESGTTAVIPKITSTVPPLIPVLNRKPGKRAS